MTSIYAASAYGDIKTQASDTLSINKNPEYSTAKEKLQAFGKQYHFFLTEKDPKSYRYVTNLNKVLIGKLGFFDNLVYSILHFFSSFSDASEWSFTVEVCKKYLEKNSKSDSSQGIKPRSWSDPTPVKDPQGQPRARSHSEPSRPRVKTSVDGSNPFSFKSFRNGTSSTEAPSSPSGPKKNHLQQRLALRARGLHGDAYVPDLRESEYF